MSHTVSILFACALVGGAGCTSASMGSVSQAPEALVASSASLYPDTAIARILRQRVESGKTPGIVVGILDAAGQRFIANGSGAPTGPRELDANTLFEIGSITKVFTSTILADMVTRGEVRLDDHVAKFLPAGTRVPATGDRQITLSDLATHYSGLPRLPNNLSPRDAANPYVDYTAEKLYAFLRTHELRRPVGAEFEYSNLGVGLLGAALSARACMDYETLVRARVLEPLGMTDTKITLNQLERSRLASGHNAGRQVVPPWELASLQGAGALRSTAAEILGFLAANIDAHTDTASRRPLAAALRLTHEIRQTLDTDAAIGLGWIWARTATGATIFSHDGGTGGHRSFAAFDPGRRVAVVVLSASSGDVNDIGRHLLDNSFPLSRERAAVTLKAATLDGLVGEYALAPNFQLAVTLEGQQLYVQATGQGRFPVFPESENSFFARVVDAQITFVRGPDSRAASLTIHQNGRTISGPRLK